MCLDWIIFHPSDPTSRLILSRLLLAEAIEPTQTSLLCLSSLFFFFLPVLNCCLSWDLVVLVLGLHILNLHFCFDTV